MCSWSAQRGTRTGILQLTVLRVTIRVTLNRSDEVRFFFSKIPNVLYKAFKFGCLLFFLREETSYLARVVRFVVVSIHSMEKTSAMSGRSLRARSRFYCPWDAGMSSETKAVAKTFGGQQDEGKFSR